MMKDTKKPTVTKFTLSDKALSVGETAKLTIKFSEKVKELTSTDFKVDNGALNNLKSTDGGQTWIATYTPKADIKDATNTITLKANSYTDLVGNKGATKKTANFTVDTVENKDTDSSLPTTFTNSNTGMVFEFVVGTSGNDVFQHTSGNKIYLGMGGNDTFSNSTSSTGIAKFIGGEGNDTYNITAGGLMSVQDMGGGSDTFNDYLTQYTGVNYTIDNKWLETDLYKSGAYVPYAGVLIGNLTNSDDFIETVNVPDLTYPLNQTYTIQVLSSMDNWGGNISSVDAMGQTASNNFYQDASTLIGIYNQYVEAGY